MKNRDKEALRIFKQMENRESSCIKGTVKTITISGYGSLSSLFSINGPLEDDSCKDNCVRCNSSDVLPRTEYETCICVHAEIRALTRNLDQDTSLYVDREPCTACTLAILDDDRITNVTMVGEPTEIIDSRIVSTLMHLGKTRQGVKFDGELLKR